MSTEPVKQPLNPGWISAGAIVVSGLLSGGISQAVTSRDVADLRVRMEAQESRQGSMERRAAEDALSNAKVLVALQKDMESANKALEAIRSAMGVRYPPMPISSNSTP